MPNTRTVPAATHSTPSSPLLPSPLPPPPSPLPPPPSPLPPPPSPPPPSPPSPDRDSSGELRPLSAGRGLLRGAGGGRQPLYDGDEPLSSGALCELLYAAGWLHHAAARLPGAPLQPARPLCGPLPAAGTCTCTCNNYTSCIYVCCTLHVHVYVVCSMCVVDYNFVETSICNSVVEGANELKQSSFKSF